MLNLRHDNSGGPVHHPAMQGIKSPPRQLQTVDRDAFRARLQWVRERTGLTKAAFADSIGITRSNYSQAEAGKRMLTVDQIFNIYVVYGVPMEYLLIGRETGLPEQFRA